MPEFIRDDPAYYAHWTSPDGRLIKIRSSPEMDAVMLAVIRERDPDRLEAMGSFLTILGDRAIELADQMRAERTPST